MRIQELERIFRDVEEGPIKKEVGKVIKKFAKREKYLVTVGNRSGYLVDGILRTEEEWLTHLALQTLRNHNHKYKK